MARSALTCIALAAAAFSVAVAAQPASAPVASAPPALEDGARLYRSTGCIQCHGGVGQGGSAGPPVFATKLGYEAFAQQVREPINAMPPYTRKVLSDADLHAIYDHVRAMRP